VNVPHISRYEWHPQIEHFLFVGQVTVGPADVEDIVAEKVRRRGRGQQKLYMVKWVGYAQCTWETEDVVETLEALNNWLVFS
jgi:hypothetical protein